VLRGGDRPPSGSGAGRGRGGPAARRPEWNDDPDSGAGGHPSDHVAAMRHELKCVGGVRGRGALCGLRGCYLATWAQCGGVVSFSCCDGLVYLVGYPGSV
jgi:hypothetical protein